IKHLTLKNEISMKVNQIVKEIIKYYFKESDVNEGEIIGLNINADARIYLIEDNGIILKFKNIYQIRKNEVQNYFEKITLNGLYQAYYYDEGVSIYTRYEDGVEGSDKIVRALEIFENFKTIHAQFIPFSNSKGSN